jgi:hypothetical protein
MRLGLTATALLLAALSGSAADRVTVTTPTFAAAFVAGTLAELRVDGATVVAPGDVNLTGILRVDRDHLVAAGPAEAATLTPEQPLRRTYSDLADLPGAVLTHEYALAGEDVVLTQQATSPQAGVHGVQWGLGLVPLTYNIVVPGNGGVRLTRDSTESSFQFDYPISWEAQFVVIEGVGHGVCIWAKDPIGRYKRLTIKKLQNGWQLGFTTHNNAPFAALTQCTSVAWQVSPYSGDWRVPAKRYRGWAAATWALTPRAAQTPVWAKDIRFLAITGQDLPVLESLARRIDPRQTLLYIPNWRKFDYDRMYPDYTANDTFPAFVEKAHALGFRIMAHVNYFGCDPKSPEYATFEKYQVRSPWSHEREWWLWERADPIIKFAYINPACKAWRDLQIARWKELVERYKVDALHLDQTLCIYNDDNGLIEGMTMVEGNLALHRELRQALPEVAISGEGLDEVTMRYEAFAQRHSYGLDFVEGTWDRSKLVMAHPVSAYVFNGFTQPYGYLGMCSPTTGQLYAAWRENYKHWGVIPTLAWPNAGSVDAPSGFALQCLQEAATFTSLRLDPDLDGDWPLTVCFPYRGRDGVRAAYREENDGTNFVTMQGLAQKEVTRVLTGVAESARPGSISGWQCYDEQRLFGLDPDTWYAYSGEPRDQKAFHVNQVPAGFTAARVTQGEQMAVVEIKDVGSVTRLARLFGQATCGSRPFAGEAREASGPLTDAVDGALFTPQGADIFAHPPWKAQRRNPQTGVLEAGGTGVAFASFPLTLPAVPGTIWFRCQVAMDKGAVGEGKTDGVLYRVVARAAGVPEATAEVLNATATSAALDLDLSAFRGKETRLELQTDPGPQHTATFDWARWYQPRVEVERHQVGSIGITAAPFAYALSSAGEAGTTLTRTGDTLTVSMQLPGSLILLKTPPTLVALPLDLAATPFILSFTSATGQLLERPQYASAGPGEASVGGVRRRGLSTHPPDHGTTSVDYPLVLPAGPAIRLRAFVGLREGSMSDGCVFLVKANGVQVARLRKLPGEWSELTADLSPWAGKPLVLSLVTDSDGGFNFDWANWGEVRVVTE